MDSEVFAQALTIYTWCLGAGVVGIVLLIARFYEKTSGRQTHYWLFAAPLAFFLGGMLRHVTTGRITGDALGGLLWSLGAIIQIVLCLVLFRQMTRE